ncbi:sigma-70 family RNA polymerase sigma factor [Paenibacillus nasutitermitis]|uniref:sigma-70 family RNA polymerase sigma factor n=1 Tax=Paenibacillus nasutitermitis TaxID=1652958 RepID=UPI00166DBC33|nr:sigma-70 family RNA polymerase sigma factor [Paenibacillus nasutitermitis]
MEQALQGEGVAYAELIGRYMNALYAIGFHITGDFHLAQDIAQEALIKGYLGLPDLQNTEKFATWLYTITRRTAFGFKRKRRRFPVELELSPELEDPHAIEDIVESNEQSEKVWLALNKLNELYRETAILHLIGGMSASEIHRLVGATTSAVESRLRRAKAVLKQELFDFARETLAARQLDEAFRIQVTTLLFRQLNCFYLPVADPFSSAMWYNEHFGLSSGSAPEPGCSGVSLPIGSGMEIFLLKSIGASSGYPKPFELLSFEVDDLASLVARLRQKGVSVEMVERSGKRLLSKFVDPDGHIFSLIQKIV